MINKLLTFINRNDHLKLMAANASWLMGERVIRLGIGFFIGILVATYFGPERYAPYTYTISAIYMVTAIAGLGLRNVFIRELVKKDELTLTLLGSAGRMMLFSGVLSYVVALGGVWLLKPGDESVIMMAIMGGQLLLFPFQLITYYFEAKVISKYTVKSTFVAYLIGVAGKLWIVFGGGDIFDLAAIYLLELLVTAGLLTYYGSRQGLKFRQWKWNGQVAKDLFSDSWWQILSGIMISLFMRMDQLMLYQMASDRETGLYGFAVQLAEAFYFIPVVISQSSLPNIVKSHGRDDGEFRQKIIKLTRLLVWITVALAIGVTLVGDFATSFLTNGKYAASGPMLKMIIWSLPIVALGVTQSAFLVTNNYLRLGFYFTTVGMLTNLGLNLYLIPLYGGWGAALASLISYLVTNCICAFFFPQTRQMMVGNLRGIFSFRVK